MPSHRIETSSKSGEVGVVHLGLGAFHRAHQAAYLERYRQRTGDSEWGVCSANLRASIGLVDGLRAAGHRYHVAEYADSESLTLREIGVIEETLFTGCDTEGNWGRDREALLSRMASADTRIVTLTVTEKGYFLNPASGELRNDDPMIAADIAAPKQPRTAPGLLVEALARRHKAGIAPFTVLSCDNMPDNAKRTRQAVVQLAEHQDPALASWIADEVAFPCSMVDRIVPAMTDADFERLAALGVNDPNAVVCEAFTQWVVEDHFPAGRPSWEAEGVEMVADVAPFETMKLRMLNGSHSLLAYLGALAGIETVYEGVQHAKLRALLHRYMLEEAAPTLEMPEGIDLDAYADSLLARFANDSLRHRLHQIAMDGSQKLPQRWLSAALKRAGVGQSSPCVALGMAAWIRYTSGEDLMGNRHPVDDPLAQRFQSIHHAHGRDADALVAAYLAMDDVVPSELATNKAFAQAVVTAYQTLTQEGLEEALAALKHG
ncbi:mannitol dehydrogenase family protein [Halomonas sp. A40-4]|uniref:mannitol dehydrogenase family protein n=1 Tax=Halomonas sp. A40-4 TaxID=2785909 RepID=UPI0018EF4EC8|nr:mannitol dehydrogenase family protein [Halomonas sp. A40-4]QPL44844.1 mannitol dehydrogenase family protein [Halomonas sp. A40-4]